VIAKVLAVLWAVIIFILSVMRTPKLTGVQIPYLDKIAHIVMYAIFAFLLLLAFHHLIQTNKKVILLIVSVSLGYGILMEFAQKKIFLSRSFEISDIVANLTGILIAVVIYKLNYLAKTTKT